MRVMDGVGGKFPDHKSKFGGGVGVDGGGERS